MVEKGLFVVYKLTRWSKFVLEKLPVAKLVKMSRTFLWNRRFPTELAIVFILSQMNPVHILTTKGEEERGGGASGAAAPGTSYRAGKTDGKIKCLNKKILMFIGPCIILIVE